MCAVLRKQPALPVRRLAPGSRFRLLDRLPAHVSGCLIGTLQAPFYVATKMSKIRHARLDAPSPKAWVAAGMRQIGCALPQP